MRFSLVMAAALLLACRPALAQLDAAADSLPVKPIRPAGEGPWQGALLLTNAFIATAWIPDQGGLTHLAFGDSGNLLQAVPGDAEGGERLAFPSVTPDWSANAWLSGDGTPHLRAEGTTTGATESIAMRRFALPASTGSLRMEQGFDSPPDEAGIAAPWNYCRLRLPLRVVLPIAQEPGRTTNGYQLTEPGDGQHVMTRCGGTLVMDCAFGSRYAVAAEAGAWIAAEFPEGILLMRRAGEPGAPRMTGEEPLLRAAVDREAGYAEFGLAVPRSADADDALIYSWHERPGELGPCELAEHVRGLVGP